MSNLKNLKDDASASKFGAEALKTALAAEYIGVSPSYLKHGRRTGPIEGRIPPPPFIRMGRRTIRYLKSDLDDWLVSFPKRISNHLPPLDHH